MTTWASTAEVTEITGITVTDPELAQAGAVIDIYSNRTTAASAELRPRDLTWLKQATAWQAVWQRSQAGYETRHTTARLTQDGLEIEYANEYSLTLAPLAARSLKNLSWKSDRTLRARNIRFPTGFPGFDFDTDFTREALDQWHGWRPL